MPASFERSSLHVRSALKLWDGIFHLHDLEQVAKASDLAVRPTARTLLELYRRDQVRMSRADFEVLSGLLKRDYSKR